MIKNLTIYVAAIFLSLVAGTMADEDGPVYSGPISMGESRVSESKNPFLHSMEYVGHERLDTHQIVLRPDWKHIQMDIEIRFQGTKMDEKAVEFYLWDKDMKLRSRFYLLERDKRRGKLMYTIDPAIPFDGKMRTLEHPSVRLEGKHKLDIYREGKSVTVRLGGVKLFDFGALKEYHTLRFEVKGYRVWVSNLKMNGFQY
jgi:hypothetical protein